MAWRETAEDAPVLTVTETRQITWNEATHQMLQYPDWVDILYDPDAHKYAVVGLRGSGAYRVCKQTDGVYYINCLDALTDMAMHLLEKSYVAMPEVLPVDPTPPPGEPPVGENTRVNGIWAMCLY